MRFAFYDDKGGITLIFDAPSQRYADAQSGDYSIAPEDVSPVTHYVDVTDKQVRAKEPLAYQMSVDGFVVEITGLPNGLTVETNGFSTVTDSEPLSISYDVPGTYQIRLSGLVEYLDYTEEVTVG